MTGLNSARGDRLRGWACRIRTSESVREPLSWICVTISPEVGASPTAETLRARAALYGFAALATMQPAFLPRAGGIVRNELH